MLTQQQLDNRTLGIGGSDVPSILRIPGAFKTPLEVYLEKVEGVTTKSTEAMQIGQALEPLIFERFCNDSNVNFEQPTKTLKHKQFEHLIGNLDGISKDSVLEIKTTSNEFFFKDGKNKIAEMQARHYMSVADLNECVIVTAIGTPKDLKEAVEKNCLDRLKLFVKKIQRDSRIEEFAVNVCNHFWNENVLKKNAPIFLTTKDIGLSIFKEGETIATERDLKIHAEILKDEEQIKILEKRIEMRKIELANAIKGNNHLIDSNKNTILRVVQTSRSSLQTDLLKQDHPEIFKQYSKKTPTTTLRIK